MATRLRSAHVRHLDQLASVVGVVPAGAMAADGVVLEPHHTHAILVPGSVWGLESSWIGAVAGVLAGDHPSVTLVVNGGRITYDDMSTSFVAGRPVVVIAGTGRAADAIAVVASNGGWSGELPDVMAAHPLTTVVHRTDPDAVTAALESALQVAR